MDRKALLERVVVEPGRNGGRPCIRGTRLDIAIILDGMAEGLSAQQIIDHYPQLTEEDVRAALAYAGELAKEGVWKVTA